MLNYPNSQRFFENCLTETGILNRVPSPAQIYQDTRLRQTLQQTLQDAGLGADAILERGKPAESLPTLEWERAWSVWAASRRAAFYTRAALLLLGDQQYFEYFTNTLSASYNIVFLAASNDVLQHATGHYLSGPSEDLAHRELANYWLQLYNTQQLVFTNLFEQCRLEGFIVAKDSITECD